MAVGGGGVCQLRMPVKGGMRGGFNQHMWILLFLLDADAQKR